MVTAAVISDYSKMISELMIIENATYHRVTESAKIGYETLRNVKNMRLKTFVKIFNSFGYDVFVMLTAGRTLFDFLPAANIGEEFRKLRNYCGFSMFDVASASGCSTSTPHCAETKSDSIRLYTIGVLFKALGLDVYLFAVKES